MNFDLTEFEGKDIVFIGAGREGDSFKQFIETSLPQTNFSFVDQKDGPDYLEKLTQLDLQKTVVVKTAGCPGSKVPVPYTTPTKVFFSIIKNTPATVIGVTGTKGKTTTSSMIASILESTYKDVRLCGNIGIPMLDTLSEPITNETIFVIEISSYQLAELTVSPNIAVVTNLYNDHVDYHGSLEAYWGAKKHITQFQTENDTFIFNSNIPELNKWAAESKAKTIAVSAHPSENDSLSFINLKNTLLIGEHNLANARLAASAAKLLHVQDQDIQHALESFTPVRHRLQIVATKNGLTYIDDAIASQPEAASAAIKAVSENVGPIGCIFLGGQDREYNFKQLASDIVDAQISRLVLFPETGMKILEEIKAINPAYEIHAHQSTEMNDAVSWAAQNTNANSVVLLSCGSPSYSLWKDFEEKGDQFQAAVAQL